MKQLPVKFQERDTLYCVRADYTRDLRSDWKCKLFNLCDRIRFNVLNQGRRNSIDGDEIKANLYAFAKDINQPSKLQVGPPSFWPLINGPYWVLEAGTYDDIVTSLDSFESNEYEWALISGGPPNIESNDGCIPGVGSTNTKGFWYLSSKPTISTNEMKALDDLAMKKGIDTTVLVQVVQEGCTYDQTETN